MKTYFSDQNFEPAAPCTRVRLITILCVVLAFSGGLVVSYLHLKGQITHTSIGKYIVPIIWLLGPTVMGVIWYCSRLKGYTLTSDYIVVKRVLYAPRFELAGVTSVSISKEPMKWALKIYGNDGLGAIAGTFKSKQWGKFKAYLTDNTCAVVLSWSDKQCLIVSPREAQRFIDEVKKRIR